ncbi:Conserved_hypothetical protein [Hexamita inflata]|uniref:Uncharacterized protein n=1 Tax=Hexamita inflata TaxID=28002 RepID=A0AA86UMM0_9EUKA|nr:Conserved hypothetical protein [Hexamita inflata]
MNSSGLTNVVNESSVTFVISQSKLAGSNLIQSGSNGYIASAIFVNISLNITQFDICVDSTSRLGQNSVSISIIGSETVECDLCDQQSVVYGLCGAAIQYSEIVNGMYQCVHPFEYVNNQCVCVTGYLLNNTKCINVVQSLNAISNLISNSSNDQIKLLEQKVETIETSLIIVEQSISSNISELENRILSNYSKSDNNLMLNTSVLDDRIYQNITSVKNDILMKYISADANLLANTTVLDWRIFYNVSQLQNNMKDFTIYYNESLLNLTQIIDQQRNIINNLTQQINCSSNSGYQMVNGSCVQVSCAISGQQSINGICQCVNIHSIVQSGSCVCPVNSQVVGIACVCSISGQVILNGQCACSTTGAFVNNNVCSCGVNSTNISNTCGCPNGASLVNGVCTCTHINAYISGNQCECPMFSSVVGNTCTCPTNSSLVNNICTCDKIAGQSIVNGVCRCPAGQLAVDDTCKYVINSSNFECSQEVFTQSFDVISTTHQVTASSNFSAGYVFSTSTVIQNAFIDISDNVYSTTVYPLFQSQSTFTSLKIQFGQQTFNSGSLLLPSSSVSINQMNIISRPGCQLTVHSAKLLNVLTSSLSSASIANLLVNLSFAPSSGNITLINNINGSFNVSGYQVLGTYTSTGTVAMLGLNVNSATVNVNQVSFKPTTFNVGNCSSYLFGNAATTSTIQINNFAVILGIISNFLLLGSISTTSSNNYRFGGIIAYINSNSVVNVNNVIIDSYQKFSTGYVSYSGFLVGYSSTSGSSITIQNVCIQQNSTGLTTEFVQFGLIGCNNGNSSVQNASISFTVHGVTLAFFGIIGYQGGSIYAEVLSARTSVIINTGKGSNVGSIFGYEQANNCSVQNTRVVGGNISSVLTGVGGFVGVQTQNMAIMNSSVQQTNISGLNCVCGFVGIQYQNMTIMNSQIQQTNISGSSQISGFVGNQYQYMTIMNSQIQQTNISGSSGVGGFVGWQSSEQLYLTGSRIQAVRISGGSYVGIVVGSSGTVNFTGSSSTQVYVNGGLRGDCAALSNRDGC